MFKQVLDEVTPDYKGKIDFYKIDVEEESDLAIMFNARSLPSVVMIDKNGKTRKPFVQVKYKNLKKLTYQGIVNDVLQCAYDIKENESNSNFGGCFSCEISHHKKGHS